MLTSEEHAREVAASSVVAVACQEEVFCGTPHVTGVVVVGSVAAVVEGTAAAAAAHRLRVVGIGCRLLCAVWSAECACRPRPALTVFPRAVWV